MKRVVIVGGGLGGLMLATKLGRKFRGNKNVLVSLIDRAAVHVWKPMLHSFAAGTANAHEDGVPFLAQARRAGFTYLPGEFYSIDRKAKVLHIRMTDLGDDSTTISYDICVIAIGSGRNDFGTPGVDEHCHSIDSLWHAEALNSALRSEIVKSAIRGDDINIAIVGGGATGIEFAAETARLVKVGKAYSGIDLEQRLKLTLLDAGDRILAGFPAEVAHRVLSKLQDLGVTVRTGVKVESATLDGFQLTDGTLIKAPIRVWAAGVTAPPPLSNDIEIERNNAGQIIVTPTLQTVSDPSIFALGDCSSFHAGGANNPLPPTGQVARQQANHLAEAIPAYLNGQKLIDFSYREMGSLVSLSQFGAYGTIAGLGVLPTVAIKGWFAKRMHEAFYRIHQFGLYGLPSGLIIMIRDGLNHLIKPPVRFD